jgi:hypothetical protein
MNLLAKRMPIADALVRVRVNACQPVVHSYDPSRRAARARTIAYRSRGAADEPLGLVGDRSEIGQRDLDILGLAANEAKGKLRPQPVNHAASLS